MRRQYANDSGWGLWLWLVIAAAIIWISFEAFASWQVRHAVPAPPAANRQLPSQSSDLQASQEPSRSAPAATSKAAPSGQVYRCGNVYSPAPAQSW